MNSIDIKPPQNGGMALFNQGDTFQLVDGSKIGIVRRLRNDMWEQVNNWPKGLYYYHVDFNDGSFETYLSERMMVRINNILQQVVTTNLYGCQFNIGDRIIVSNKTIRLMNPIRDEYIATKRGIVSKIIPRSPYSQPPNICYYEVRFDDGSIAPEINEDYLRTSIPIVYDNTNQIGTDLRNIMMLNNMNQILNRNQIIQQRTDTYDYIDLSESKDLQKEVIKFYYKKTLKWLENNPEFNKVKKHLAFLKTEKGIKYLKSLVKLYVKKNKVKWYEMRKDNYDEVKDFIKSHLNSI
jgi:ribosomal protein L29